MTTLRREADLRMAMNAISDVVENRPPPLRDYDQIYMKSGDILRQAETVASWANEKKLAFIGDGDGISAAVCHLKNSGIIDFGPSQVRVFDFDQRITNSIERFADYYKIGNLTSKMYNCFDVFPETGEFDFFYTNPPWGQNNHGESVIVFVERGFEAIGYQGQGMVVIADDRDEEIPWPQKVLWNTQTFAATKGFYVSRMISREHQYHLFDEHKDLLSCNLVFSSLHNVDRKFESVPLSPDRKDNFYGKSKELRARYIWEKNRPDYGRANESDYHIEMLETEK